MLVSRVFTYNVLQCVAVHCSVLQYEVDRRNVGVHCLCLECVAAWCCVLQRVAVCCSMRLTKVILVRIAFTTHKMRHFTHLAAALLHQWYV